MKRIRLIGLILGLVVLMFVGCTAVKEFMIGLQDEEFAQIVKGLQEKLEKAEGQIKEENVVDLNLTRETYKDMIILLEYIKSKQMSWLEMLLFILGGSGAVFGSTHLHRLKKLLIVISDVFKTKEAEPVNDPNGK